jgi:hypothetical protein
MAIQNDDDDDEMEGEISAQNSHLSVIQKKVFGGTKNFPVGERR